MSKRKLTRQQKWRQTKVQQERIERASKKSDEKDGAVKDVELIGPESQGRVIANFGAKLLVEDDQREIVRCHSRTNLGQIVVGDYVIFQHVANSDDSVVVALCERRTCLERTLYHGEVKQVAANIDQILIFATPVPALQPVLIDRYLIATELAGIDAVVVFNKVDLVNEENQEEFHEVVDLYRDLGYHTLLYSNKVELGLQQLEDILANKTSILVGQSGVGKSSTIKRLLPDRDIIIGDLNEKGTLGKHTTSASRLYHLPHGGEIIDSPGVRDFGLWHVDKDKIISGYPELRDLPEQCQFRNCSHRHEPGCALTDAAQTGKISWLRLRNFWTIMDAVNDAARED